MALSAFTPLLALLLDRLLGEPRRWHPLVLFGHCAVAIEKRFYGSENLSFVKRQSRGFIAALLLILPPTLLALLLVSLPVVGTLFALIILYGCLGLQSLREHAQAVAKPLLQGDIPTARQAVAMMVSRDTQDMDVTQITRATIESVLENGNDAVFATLFWFFVLGAPGAVLLRAANTLDAMWGYKTERHLHFGFFAAKLDDTLNWIPARLTALTFALLGHTKNAWYCWQTQAPHCASPNGGPVMCSGAGSLDITLGGDASYHGQWQEKPLMGQGKIPQAQDIERALQRVNRAAWLWVLCYAIIALLLHA